MMGTETGRMNMKKSGCAYTNMILSFSAHYIMYISLLLVPLYMRDGYFGLIGAKARCYRIFVVPAVIVCLLAVSARLFINVQKKEIVVPAFRVSTFLLASISCWALFSSLCSLDKSASFYGTMGWSVGSLMILLLTFSTWLIAGHLKFDVNQMLPVIAVNILIFLMAIMQFSGQDPFQLLESIPHSYNATIGQKNSFAGYLCLILPLFMGFYAVCERVLSKAIYLFFLFLGFLCIILCDSDGVYAGIGFSCFFMIPFFLDSFQRAKCAGELLSLFGMSLLIADKAPLFHSKTAKMGVISSKMISFKYAVIIIVAGLVLILFVRVMEKKNYQNVLRILIFVMEAFLIVITLVLFKDAITHFNDSWGSGRGRIWRVTIEEFKKLSAGRKWIGVGPELLAIPYAAIRKKKNMNLLSAHNDALQVLLAQGIIGLILYSLFWVYLIFLYIRGKLWKKNTGVFFFPIIAYFGQSMFASVYPVTGVVFSVMTALYLGQAETLIINRRGYKR